MAIHRQQHSTAKQAVILTLYREGYSYGTIASRTTVPKTTIYRICQRELAPNSFTTPLPKKKPSGCLLKFGPRTQRRFVNLCLANRKTIIDKTV
jgi:hypothetical protein